MVLTIIKFEIGIVLIFFFCSDIFWCNWSVNLVSSSILLGIWTICHFWWMSHSYQWHHISLFRFRILSYSRTNYTWHHIYIFKYLSIIYLWQDFCFYFFVQVFCNIAAKIMNDLWKIYFWSIFCKTLPPFILEA